MSTNQEILDLAAQELGYIEAGSSLDATDSADALITLNDLMEEWRVRDLDLNWFIQDTLADTAPIPSWARSGVISNLAVRLGALFNVAPAAQTVIKADRGEKAIATVLMNLSTEGGQDMSHMNRGEGHYSSWDIETDA